MAFVYDQEFYANVEGVRTLSYVVRPSIFNNQLGPLSQNASIAIRILNNGQPVALFQYDIVQPIPDGKQLYATAIFQPKLANESDTFNPAGEVIICKDVPIELKVGDTFVLDHVERPRNVRRDMLGPFKLLDVLHVDFLLDGQVRDDWDYSPTSAFGEGKVLAALGAVDFVELVGQG